MMDLRDVTVIIDRGYIIITIILICYNIAMYRMYNTMLLVLVLQTCVPYMRMM